MKLDVEPVREFRRTRFVCISDTHNCTVKLPRGDVLIHAGDLTNQGSFSEISRAVKWLEEADFEAKIVVAGNHDITLDRDFYMNHGHAFHNQTLQSPDDCISLFQDSATITYLHHDSATIRLSDPSGPHTWFNVFGSPFSQRHGLWAFGYDGPSRHNPSTELTSLWDLIPLNTDVVITHTPPRTHCDSVEEQNRPQGCEALRQALWRVRPQLAVCGHLHQGRGAERVRWDLEDQNTAFAEISSTPWQDPGEDNNKMSLIDLTGKKGVLPRLANDGGISVHDSTDNSSENIGQNSVGDRVSRAETFVINAAVMKSRYPHKGGKEFNKPIVVDIHLPVW